MAATWMPGTVRPEFAPHEHSEDAAERIADLRLAFSTLLAEVERCVPQGRERSIVLTKLQEASMWAIRGAAAAKAP